MTALQTLLLAGSLSLLSPLLQASELQEADVHAMLTRADAAIARKDVEAIGQQLADNLQIRMIVHAGDRTQQSEMGKQEYLANLRQSWAIVSDYSYQRVDSSIEIDAGVGTVQSTVTERMTIQGMSMQANTKETTRIEMINGRPQVTAITADSWLQ